MSLSQILIAEMLFANFFLFFFFEYQALSLASFHEVFKRRGRRRERWRDCVKFLLMHNAFIHCTFWIDATNQPRNDSCFLLTDLQ